MVSSSSTPAQVHAKALTDCITAINQIATPDVPMWAPTKVYSYTHHMQTLCRLLQRVSPQSFREYNGQPGVMWDSACAVLCEFGATEQTLQLLRFYLQLP